MGPTGPGIFDSTEDDDVGHEISEQAGLCLVNPDDPKCGGKGSEYTRKVLNDGLFTKLFDSYKDGDVKLYVFTWKYFLVILTSMSMRLGADISDEQRAYMKSIYKSAGLFEGGIKQMGEALDKYECGTPLDIEELDAGEVDFGMSTYHNFSFNHIGNRFFEDDVPTPDICKASAQMYCILEICGVCDKDKATLKAETGRDLKRCAGCKIVQYCDRVCQKRGWPIHKHFCPAGPGVHPNFQVRDLSGRIFEGGRRIV